jgi:hypothetical protein
MLPVSFERIQPLSRTRSIEESGIAAQLWTGTPNSDGNDVVDTKTVALERAARSSGAD